MRKINKFSLNNIEGIPYIPQKNEFKKYFDSLRKYDYKKTEDENPLIDFTYTNEILSSLTKIPKETLRKIINKTQPTANRDIIIALCIIIKLDLFKTNDALLKYGFLPLSEDAPEGYITRDKLLAEILYTYNGDLSILDINAILISMKFEPLDLPISSCSDKEGVVFEKEFEIIRYFIKPRIEEYYLDLSSKFNADRYACSAFMVVRNILTGDEYNISGSEKKEFFISGGGKTEKLERFEHKDKLKFIIEFLSMEIDKQVRVLKNQYDDSKNYGIRTTAKYENGRIMFISESFNYRIPELPMYIMIEDNSHETKISISKRSMFLNRVLGETNYKKIYNNSIPKHIAVFESVQEIENDSEWFSRNSYTKKTIVSTCKDVIKSIEQLKESIRNKNEFISSTELIEGDPEEFYLLCKSLKLVKEFAFKKYDEFYFSNKESISHDFNGQVYTITREDVELAAQLGMKNADEICLVLERVGCIANLYKEM